MTMNKKNNVKSNIVPFILMWIEQKTEKKHPETTQMLMMMILHKHFRKYTIHLALVFFDTVFNLMIICFLLNSPAEYSL